MFGPRSWIRSRILAAVGGERAVQRIAEHDRVVADRGRVGRELQRRHLQAAARRARRGRSRVVGDHGGRHLPGAPRLLITSTLVSSVPATTCAFVITSSGPMTKPVPSSCRLHDGALPRIFRTLFCDVLHDGAAGQRGIRRPDLR